jgi:hypothetical protein
MSNTEFRFLSGPRLDIYNYITGEMTTSFMLNYDTMIPRFDTYNDYWIYVYDFKVFLEEPNIYTTDFTDWVLA